MTLLTVVNDAEDLLTQTRSTAVCGATGLQARQMSALLKQVGRDLVKIHDWNKLLTPLEFTCLSTEAQTNYPPDDFDRMADHTEVWNNTRDWKVFGPLTSVEWADLTVRNVQTLPQYWRLNGGVLQIFAPNAGDDMYFEYISKNWIYEAGNTSSPADECSDDTDTFVFDEWLLTLGLVWRWRKAKGFDYAEELVDYERYLEKAIKSDKGGLAVIETDPMPRPRGFKTWPGTINT